METRTILLSFMTLIVVGIAILVIYGLLNSSIVSVNPISPQKTSVTLLPTLHSGMDPISLSANLPLSMNESDGMEFSYTAWVLINDFSYGVNSNPNIFTRGTGSPSVTFPVNRNTIVISQKTYNGSEEIRIRNMPSEKLFHLGVVVTQTTLDVYVNGLLHTHKSLDSLPVIENAPIQVGIWKGKIGSFVYYNYALSPGEIRSVASTRAVRDPSDEPPNPPYFDTSWWIGRRG
jgi:hypothetical protein